MMEDFSESTKTWKSMVNPTRYKARLLFLGILVLVKTGSCSENQDHFSGADYLESTMGQLQIERFKSALGMLAERLALDRKDKPDSTEMRPDLKEILYRIVSPEQESTAYYEIENPNLLNGHGEDKDYPPYPPLSDKPSLGAHNYIMKVTGKPEIETKNETNPLSKEELTAIYHAAVNKGASLNISSLPDFVDENGESIKPASQGTLPGYYYYFYPLKDLYKNNINDVGGYSGNDIMAMQNMMMQAEKQPQQGQGGMMTMMQGGGSQMKRFEPLFIAMASFVSMAMMFILSILFMPKFGNVRSDVAAVKEATEDGNLYELSSVVFEAIEGRNCSQRLTCEIGQAIRLMKLGAKPIRALEIFLPKNLANQLANVRKSSIKRERCDHIPCWDASEKFSKPFTVRRPIYRNNSTIRKVD